MKTARRGITFRTFCAFIVPAVLAGMPTSICAQTVDAAAYIAGEDLEIHSHYYNNTTVKWENGVLTVYPNTVSPMQQASRSSGVAFAKASADLTTGKTKAHALASGGNFAQAIAGYYDILTFQVSGVDSSTITPIHIITTAHTTYPTFVQGGVSVTIDGTYVGYSFNGNFDTPFWSQTVGLDKLAGYSTYMDGDSRVLDMVYNLTGGSQILNYRQQIDAYSTFGLTSETWGDVRFVLPDNVSFTSATGQFLTSNVPEAGTWAMMLGGFGLIGAVMRRRLYADVSFG
jgi:hypothetical protein